MSNEKDTLRKEYSEQLIKSGVRGKYVKRYRQGARIVSSDQASKKPKPRGPGGK
jgi:hypothetical protein